jgi:AcrR family transcriptional regulator
MEKIAKEKPKDRIVRVAAKLFYSHGINAVGVDRISTEADVSKRTLYKYFPSKETLVSTAISSLGQGWFEACIDASSDDPTARITHVFKMVEPMAKIKDFYGCVLMNTSIELRGSDDLGTNVARDFKGQLYTYFKEQATLLGAKEPDTLAEQLVLLYDGCSAWIVMRREFPASTFRTLDLLLKTA